MKVILVPIDFSSNAMNAARYALSLATCAGTRVVLFHATEVPVAIKETSGFILETGYLDNEYDKLLHDIADDLKSLFPNVEIDCMSAIGNLTHTIATIAEQKDIDLIVMGTKGASGLKEAFMGSNTSEVIENVGCPLLAVPEFFEFRPFKKIFYATDYQYEDFQMINNLCHLAKLWEAEVVIGHITTALSDSKDQELMEWFVDLAGSRIHYDNVDFVLHRNEDFFEGITDLVKQQNIDMLAISTVKKAFFSKLFGVNHTKTLVCHLPVPLLAYHILK